MNIRRIGIAGVLAALALNAWAGPGAPSAKVKFDVTGTWSATVTSGTAPATNLVFVLKQDGVTVGEHARRDLHRDIAVVVERGEIAQRRGA